MEDSACLLLLNSINRLGCYRGEEYRKASYQLKKEGTLCLIEHRLEIIRASWLDRDEGASFRCPACVNGISDGQTCARCNGTGRNIAFTKVTLVLGISLNGNTYEWRFPPSTLSCKAAELPEGNRESFRREWGDPECGPRGLWSPAGDLEFVEWMTSQWVCTGPRRNDE